MLSCELQHMNGKSLPVQMKKEMDRGEKSEKKKKTLVGFLYPMFWKNHQNLEMRQNVRLYNL